MNTLKKANTSLILGIISFIVPLWFCILFYSLFDTGSVYGYIAGGLVAYFGLIAVGVVALALAILSVIFGLTVLLKIKKEPGIYAGKGKAIAGITLSLIFPIIMFIRIMYMLLRK